MNVTAAEAETLIVLKEIATVRRRLKETRAMLARAAENWAAFGKAVADSPSLALLDLADTFESLDKDNLVFLVESQKEDTARLHTLKARRALLLDDED